MGYKDVPQPLVFTILWVALGNSFWNSLIYFFMNNQYRQRTKELVLKLSSWKFTWHSSNSVTPDRGNGSFSGANISDHGVENQAVTVSSNSAIF